MTSPSPEPKTLPLDVLVLTAGTQSRDSMSEYTVEEYADVLAKSDGDWPFPPLEVFYDGSRYLLAAGFHRTLAARRMHRESAPCLIHQGSAWDALIHGMHSNIQHGLRPTQADKRRAVEMLLDGEVTLTQAVIADHAGVVERTVRRIVADRREEQVPDRTLSGPAIPSNGQEDAKPTMRDRDPIDRQRSKTIKTAEALVREFDALDDLRNSPKHSATISACQSLIVIARGWP